MGRTYPELKQKMPAKPPTLNEVAWAHALYAAKTTPSCPVINHINFYG